MKESQFQTLFTRGVRATFGKDTIYHKISDESSGLKPYDCFLACDNGFYAFELKVCHNLNSFTFRPWFKGREHQITCLERSNAHNVFNYAFVVVYFDKIREAYMIPWHFIEHDLDHKFKMIDILQYKMTKIRRKHHNDLVWDVRKGINI